MAQKPATTRIPRQLRESDVHGKGAAEIGWGTPGDFDRCRAFMRRHDVPGYEIDGACANLHRIATGEWPGKNAHKGHLASVAVISLTAAAGPADGDMIRWRGPLAVVGEPTGDRRRFPHDTLKYQSFPQPFRFQRQGLPGHQGAITVGVIEDAKEQTYTGSQKELQGKRVIYGHGYFLDPDIIPEVNEAIHLAEHGVSGPSVDLDSYTAVLKKNALSGETTADMVRGRQRAATLVSVPAFADLRIEVVRPKGQTPTLDESDGPDTAIVAGGATFAVNTVGWHGAPIAPREALFDADDAAKRIEGWANGDPKKMSSMFLWIADSANAPLIGRKGYRLPWGDIIDGKPYLIYHAVYAAAALLEGAHGGLPNIPDEEKAKLRAVVSSIYENLAAEYDDPSIIAPWDRQAQQQQASGGLAWNDADATDVDEYAYYVSCYTAALEEFVRHHRYTERKHPRDPRKDDHAGEWIDTPHGPHGQIKVGGKWVYPPKRGEKGYKSPEKSARGIAKRGGGKSGGEGGKAKRGPGTHVVRKAKPETHKAAPSKKRGPYGDDHEGALRSMDRQAQKRYLADLSDDEINSLVKKVGGHRLDDDSRDDLETEIIRQVNKGPGESERNRRKDEETKRKDKQLREISHGEDGKRKTTVGKKEPEPKPERKTPEPKKEPEPESRKWTQLSDDEKAKVTQDRSRQLDTLKKNQDVSDLLAPLSKQELLALAQHRNLTGNHKNKTAAQLRGDLERGPRMRIYKDVVDDTFKKKESERKTPEPKPEKEPEPKKPGTVVGKKSGEHKVTPAQRKALESLRDDENAKIHPATKKVLQREGFLDDNGKLTDSGRKHVGGKEKAPEPKTPAPKPEPKKRGGTVVGKKEHKLTAAQRKALDDVRDQGTDAKIHPATKKVLQREGFLDENGKLTHEGRKRTSAPGPQKPEAKKPKTPEKPERQQKLAAKYKLTENQKDELRALHHHGPINLDLMGKKTRESLERKGLINSKGELTEEGKAVAKELVDAEPKPVTPPPPPPSSTRPKAKFGHWSSSASPRPVPKFPEPKDKNPDLEGPQRPKTQTRRERELRDLRQQLRQAEQFREEWIKGWEEALERAKREGGDVAYFEKSLKASKERVGDLKARIGMVEKAPKEPYWDTPAQEPGLWTGTPTREQVDAHVKKIVKGGIPPIYRPQVEGQLRHQGTIAPRSLSTLSLVDIPSGSDSLYEQDPGGFGHTLAYYQATYRRIHLSPRWEKKPVDTSDVVQRDAHAGWFHLSEDGTTPVEAILSHEIGHHVAYRALANVRSQELLESIIREYKLPADTKVDYKSIEDALKKYASGVKHELSVYGTSSMQELLAETWAEYTNGGKHLRPNVKRVGDIMRELAEDTDVVI